MSADVRGESRVRWLDRLLALVGLVAAAPLLVAAAAGIKISDSGPILHRAARVGRGGRQFVMFKLRTMRVDQSNSSSGRITGRADHRVFAWGRLLRRFKVDELPQLVNVVRGDMAIVGPRPEDPSIVEGDYAPWMLETLTVPPGLTSPGSLDYYAAEAGLPDDSVTAEEVYVRELLARKLAADLVYVRNRSGWYDLQLVLRTVASLVGWHTAFRSSQAGERMKAERILREEARR